MYYLAGDAQFQIISMDKTAVPLCVTIDNDETSLLTKSKCKKENGAQLFKWIQDSDLLQHTETGFCVTGTMTKWGNVSRLDSIYCGTMIYR